MNTGTPLDLTPFGVVLQGTGLLYWLLVLALLALVLWKAKGVLAKGMLATAVLVIMVGPVAVYVVQRSAEQQQAKKQLDAAMALFDMRCKSAGERISRTAANVEGVVWMKWRGDKTNDHDQFKLDDPYGHDCSGEACIADLLRVSKGAELNPEEANRHSKGYRSVYATDATGQSRAYAGVIKLRPIWTEEAIARQKARTGKGVEPSDHEYTIERRPIEKLAGRYGVTWDDISTREDREHWIAGGSLKVVDLQTNEVIAERVGYMLDRGQGNVGGGRQPWAYAVQDACPEFARETNDSRRGRTRHETRDFVLKVLQPSQGE